MIARRAIGVPLLLATLCAAQGCKSPSNPTEKKGTGIQTALPAADVLPTCAYEVAPASIDVAADGEDVVVNVTTAAACEWTVETAASFISVIAGLEPRRGPGTVALRAEKNQGSDRTAEITIAGKTIVLKQAAAAVPAGPSTPGGPSAPAACVFEVDPMRYIIGYEGGVATFQITAPAGCPWSASTADDFYTFEGAKAGVGSGSVSVKIAAFFTDRTGTMIIAGHTVTIVQGRPIVPSPD